MNSVLSRSSGTPKILEEKSLNREELLGGNMDAGMKKKKNKHYQEGCMRCGLDNDHANLLICESCEAEYHTYCLDPPLTRIPSGDWYCDKCKPINQNKDNLDERVAALPPEYTTRFGEIVWAAGGQGFGWWPACIYDPRLTAGVARKLATKQLGKKHLVYFFACQDAPFTVLNEGKIILWEDGLLDDMDSGRAARAISKSKGILFEQAFHIASAEYDKPVEYRLDWNHTGNDPITGPNGGRAGSAAYGTPLHAQVVVPRNAVESLEKGPNSSDKNSSETRRKRARRALVGKNEKNNGSQSSTRKRRGVVCKPISPPAIDKENNSDKLSDLMNLEKDSRVSMSDEDDTEIFCRIMWITSARTKSALKGKPKKDPILSTSSYSSIPDDLIMSVGFISLPTKKSTFAEARKVMEGDLDRDLLPRGTKWKFYVPNLGPMSLKQESSLGPLLDFLLQSTNEDIGKGSSLKPLHVFIFSTKNVT